MTSQQPNHQLNGGSQLRNATQQPFDPPLSRSRHADEVDGGGGVITANCNTPTLAAGQLNGLTTSPPPYTQQRKHQHQKTTLQVGRTTNDKDDDGDETQQQQSQLENELHSNPNSELRKLTISKFISTIKRKNITWNISDDGVCSKTLTASEAGHLYLNTAISVIKLFLALGKRNGTQLGPCINEIMPPIPVKIVCQVQGKPPHAWNGSLSCYRALSQQCLVGRLYCGALFKGLNLEVGDLIELKTVQFREHPEEDVLHIAVVDLKKKSGAVADNSQDRPPDAIIEAQRRTRSKHWDITDDGVCSKVLTYEEISSKSGIYVPLGVAQVFLAIGVPHGKNIGPFVGTNVNAMRSQMLCQVSGQPKKTWEASFTCYSKSGFLRCPDMLRDLNLRGGDTVSLKVLPLDKNNTEDAVLRLELVDLKRAVTPSNRKRGLLSKPLPSSVVVDDGQEEEQEESLLTQSLSIPVAKKIKLSTITTKPQLSISDIIKDDDNKEVQQQQQQPVPTTTATPPPLNRLDMLRELQPIFSRRNVSGKVWSDFDVGFLSSGIAMCEYLFGAVQRLDSNASKSDAEFEENVTLFVQQLDGLSSR